MRGAQLFLVLVPVLMTGVGCETGEPDGAELETATETAPAPPPAQAATTTDTATEVGLYGLVSWADATADGKPVLVALMPDTSDKPQCLREEPAPRHAHHPVLKIVTGSFSWTGDALPQFGTDRRVFSLAGQDVTIGEGEFHPLAKEHFELVSSDASLNETKSKTIGSDQTARLDPALRDERLVAGTRLGARVRFGQGRAVASLDACHEGDPIRYLAEQNTVIDNGQGAPDCPDWEEEGLDPRVLAEEMLVRLQDTGTPLILHFREWEGVDPKTRTLTIEPNPDGVRIELSNQMQQAAEALDTRDPALCGQSVELRDYLWYYDLVEGRTCPDPTLFPCDTTLGGTKCPHHEWEG